MAWVRILKSAPVAEKTERKPQDRKPWVKFESNGGSGVLLLLSTTATRSLKLKPGDHVALMENRGRVAVLKDRRGEFKCAAHGTNPNRLKISVTTFYKENIAHRGDLLGTPFAVKMEEIDGATAVVFYPRHKRQAATTPAPAEKKPAKKTAVAATTGGSKVTAAVPAPKRGRPRKVTEPATEPVAS